MVDESANSLNQSARDPENEKRDKAKALRT